MLRIVSSLLLLLFLLSCQPNPAGEETSFRQLPEAEYFSFDTQRDTVLFGRDGIRLIIPAGSFRTEEGEEAQGIAQLSLQEAVSLEDRILMNTTDANRLGGARVIVEQDASPLKVNKKAPILIQFPLVLQENEVYLQYGDVRRNGKVRWRDGPRRTRFLLPVDFSSLAFHPASFAEELEMHLPFGTFQNNSIPLSDSLYFSYAGGRIIRLTDSFENTYLNEAYYNRKHVFTDGSYTVQSYDHNELHSEMVKVENWPKLSTDCSIDPVEVQVLKSPDFATTFLATIAFTERLQCILEIGDTDLLAIYTQQLDANLWELDQMAADYLRTKQHPLAIRFDVFANQGLTNTKDGAKYADLFRRSYTKRKEEFNQLLEAKQAEIITALKQENESIARLKVDYREILWQREKHRMEAYSFTLTEVGWMWLHRDPPSNARIQNTIAWMQLTVDITNRGNYEEIYVYVVFPQTESIYRLNSDDQKHFYVGAADEKMMLMRVGEAAELIAVAYRDDQLYTAQTNISTRRNNQSELSLTPSSQEAFRAVLARYKMSSTVENNLENDLLYARQLLKEGKRQLRLRQEEDIIRMLAEKAYPGCNQIDLMKAEASFMTNCTSCHDRNLTTKLTGPALQGVTQRHNKIWFIRWVSNSQALIASDDPEAIALWRDWGPTVMSSFYEKLSTKEIADIYEYLAQF